MSKHKQNIAEESVPPTNFQRHLPFWLPVLQPKKDKKKCCKKHKEGNRCKKCPNR